jgi:hypothetical protein
MSRFRRRIPCNDIACDIAVEMLGGIYVGKFVAHCRRDKGMLNGWSFNRESMAGREKGNLETHCMESLLVVFVCVLAISNRCQKLSS